MVVRGNQYINDSNKNIRMADELKHLSNMFIKCLSIFFVIPVETNRVLSVAERQQIGVVVSMSTNVNSWSPSHSCHNCTNL